MKLTPTQAKAIEAAIAMYHDRGDGEHDVVLYDFVRQPEFQALVKQAR